MPNILTSVRHTKRHLNYLKLYSHCPENAADSADVFTLSNITPHPEIFPFKPRSVFFPRAAGSCTFASNTLFLLTKHATETGLHQFKVALNSVL